MQTLPFRVSRRLPPSSLPGLFLLAGLVGAAPLAAQSPNATSPSAFGVGLAAAPHSSAVPQQRLLICGDRLLDAAQQVPSGLPSRRCSEAQAFGEVISAPSLSAPDIDPAEVAKLLDGNSLALREALLLGSSLGAVYLHVIEESTSGPLEVFRLEIDDTRVEAISGGAGDAGPAETAELTGGRYTWSVWLPPAPPSTKPTLSFCWSAITQGPC